MPSRTYRSVVARKIAAADPGPATKGSGQRFFGGGELSGSRAASPGSSSNSFLHQLGTGSTGRIEPGLPAAIAVQSTE